ncbi:MAG: aquaporin [Acidimicrobiia bacterium]|nr:aquaporin [Acidimicrobiia bacterium]
MDEDVPIGRQRYAVGHVSGGHFNPAVTLGLVAGGKFDTAKVAPYIATQVVGGLLGGLIVYIVASGRAGFEVANAAGTFATNGYGDFSPGGFGLGSVFVAEVVLNAIFLIIILGATGRGAAPGFGGLAIGHTLTLIHLISIPVSNTSVNPARSTAQAVSRRRTVRFGGGSPPGCGCARPAGPSRQRRRRG